jgi:putative colanic acid biosynthesis UDP-glucose lipid carrier transferase
MRAKDILPGNSKFGFILQVGDLLAIAAGAIVAYRWHFNDLAMPFVYQQAILISLLLSLILFNRFSVYRVWRGSSLLSELWTATGALVAAFTTLSALAFVTRHYHDEDIHVKWGIAWMGFSWLFMVFFRASIRTVLNLMRAWGFNRRRVAVIVAGELGLKIAETLKDAPWTGLDVIGYFDDRTRERLPTTNGVPLLGTVADLGTYRQKHRIDEVWLAFPFRAEERIKEVLYELRHCTTDIRMVPDIFQFRLLNYSMSEVAGMPVLNLTASPMVGFARFLKGLEDRLLALLLLLLLSPLIVAIAIGIKLSSPGPVLFKQKRHGWDGKPITIWKFRTMKVHQEENGKVTQATRNDPRITKLGALLRRTSVDELPQFFNVLQGRMSIVGPRPHAIEHNEFYKDSVSRYMLRHKVKPGITGWAQIHGYRGEIDSLEKIKKRIEYDLFYIENWSVWFDLKIIVATLIKGLINKNAY